MTEEKDIETFILEDDADMNILLKQICEDEGIDNVYFFTNSRELLLKLNPRMRVLVIDWKLDERMNGLQVMSIVREKNPGCYVIVVSGYANDNTIIQFLNARADWFIKKHANYLFELIEEIRKGRAIVAKRDKLLNGAMAIYQNIENRRKLRNGDDTGSAY